MPARITSMETATNSCRDLCSMIDIRLSLLGFFEFGVWCGDRSRGSLPHRVSHRPSRVLSELPHRISQLSTPQKHLNRDSLLAHSRQLQYFPVRLTAMPPKKAVEVPKAGTGDETAPQKEQQVRDGTNIEVCHCSPHCRIHLTMF